MKIKISELNDKFMYPMLSSRNNIVAEIITHHLPTKNIYKDISIFRDLSHMKQLMHKWNTAQSKTWFYSCVITNLSDYTPDTKIDCRFNEV